ncbi:transglutaminase-like putative cysteine protease [Sphingomonas kyeonggiensis]|uniref:Transglutaminase-like putative cysteine protease n=1 Tax=Sphingomonas kyeonggiensis TaxID=1268553 RepID=A0A7W7JYI9_9SPHN|nr:transglutaminase family protein [Sphingomonas kyeonggiensis]MBB4837698.1 transglutaminase-like putative cysteine protease [Sphingomonas kyeonggiensis]
MLYRIRHVTRFDYAQPVGFARCNLRLKPILWSGQEVLDYALSVEPGGRTFPARAEAGLANVVRLVMENATSTLTIESSARIRVERPIPVPSSSDPTLAGIARLARESRDASPASPASYLFPSPQIPLDGAIAQWCAPDLAPDRGVLEAAYALATRIQREFDFDPSATLVDTPPRAAFDKRRGVCQDFAQIMISGLRAAGLPAAYVSGYLRTLPPPGQPRLVGADATHAWVLVWAGPDLGWVGVDPTNGIWMAEDHVVMAIGRDYAEIAPIDGIVLGSGAQDMHVSVDVEPLEEAGT